MNLNNKNILISFSTPKYNERIDLTNSGQNLNKRKKSFIVGYIQQMNLSQQRQISKFFEIDNKEYEMVASKVRTNLQVNRVLLDGPSIMKYVAYALYGKDVNYDGQDDPRETPDHEIPQHKFSFHNRGYDELVKKVAQDMGFIDDIDVQNIGWGRTPDKERPGTSDFWVNLTSGIFEKPIGIYLDIHQKGAGAKPYSYGGVFLENCMISNYTISTQANNRMLSENMTIEVGMPIPCIGYDGQDISQLAYNKQHERISNPTQVNVLNPNDPNPMA